MQLRHHTYPKLERSESFFFFCHLKTLKLYQKKASKIKTYLEIRLWKRQGEWMLNLEQVNFHLQATENHKRFLTRRAKWSKMPFNNEMCGATSGMNQSGSEKWVVGRGLCTQLRSRTQDQVGSSYNTHATKGNDHFGSHGKTKTQSENLKLWEYGMLVFIEYRYLLPILTFLWAHVLWLDPSPSVLPWSFRIFWVTSYIAYGKCGYHWSNPK